jgi:PAS domain S-box-containing protein
MDKPTAFVSDAGSLLGSLLASSGDCIKILDLDGNLVFMTETAQLVMEVTDFNKIKGCPWPEFWQGQGNIDAKAALEAAKAGGTGHFQGFATTMAGTPKWWDVSVTPILGPDQKPEKLLSISRDITATRLAAQALESSERQFRVALHAGRLGHWNLDFATGAMTTSDICRDNFGRDDADFTYDELRAAVHPDDQARMRAAVERTISTGVDYDIEFRIVRPDGTVGWVMIRGQLVRDARGKPSGMSGVSLDIGAQKAAEQALVESEARFKTFAQAMPNQVWSSTPDGRLDWFNDQVYSYSGLAFLDLRGTGWARIVHPDDIENATAAWATSLAEATPYQTQFRLRRADGTWRWHLARALPIKDQAGAITRWIGTNTDIDDQKVAEADLIESELRAAAAVDAADIGTWDFDPRTGVLKWDKRCYELFGLAPGKPVSFDTFLAGVHPDDRDATEAACLSAMQPDDSKTYDIAYRTIGFDDGVERWVSAKGRSDFENGTVIRFIGTIRDISDLKRAEAQQRLLTESSIA